jgi:hypothetical protein
MIRGIVLGLIGVVFSSIITGAQPALPATELAGIVGIWEGSLTTRGQTYPITLTIDDNGTWESRVPGVGAGRFTGTVRRADDGKFRYRTNENGITGTYTLRERDGKRVLELLNDPHTTSATMTPK